MLEIKNTYFVSRFLRWQVWVAQTRFDLSTRCLTVTATIHSFDLSSTSAKLSPSSLDWPWFSSSTSYVFDNKINCWQQISWCSGASIPGGSSLDLLTDKKLSCRCRCRCGRRATAHTVSAAVLSFKVIQGQWFSCHFKANMWLLVINSNLGTISHRLATACMRNIQTDGRRPVP